MPQHEHASRIARQPFTLGGVARFSAANIGRLVVAAVLFGAIFGAVMSWFATTCIAPVIDEAVEKLPATGVIEGGALEWPERTGRLLAANAFTSIEVRLEDSNVESAPVDFAFELRTNSFVLRSLLGIQEVDYPRSRTIEINRTVLSPAWGAWRAPILFGLIPGTILALIIGWSLLATVYALVALAIAKSFSRDLTYWRAWKLCVAAQLPGSLIITFALALYSTGKISVVFVFAMYAAHFLPTLIYVLFSPLFLLKADSDSTVENPFDKEPRKKTKGKNPFARK